MHDLIRRALKHPHTSEDYPFDLETQIKDERPNFIRAAVIVKLCLVATIIWSFHSAFPIIALKLFYFGTSPYIIFFLLFIVVRDEMTKRALGWHSGVAPGLYYKDTPENQRIRDAWPAEKRSYKPPWWCWTGDLCTITPFIINPTHTSRLPKIETKKFRIWLKVVAHPNDGEERNEAIALDWFFPEDGQPPKKLILCLHGLNGSSQESYVHDLIVQAVSEGNAVVVMIARGMGKTPMQTPYFFHGARTSDLESTLEMLETVNMPYHAVGFSMGGIVIANFVTRAGDAVPKNLQSVVSVSGALDLTSMANPQGSTRTKRVWQPYLLLGLTINISRFRKMIEKKLNYSKIPMVFDLPTYDAAITAPFNDFGTGPEGLRNFYEAASGAPGPKAYDNVHNIKRKMLHIHADNDPIVSIDYFREHINIEAENTWYLVTKSGGHVGFPTGTLPWRHGWEFMSNCALSFIYACDAAKI